MSSHCIPHFTLSQVVNKTYIDSLTCKLCKSGVSDPVEVLPCKSLTCCSCLLGLVSKDMDKIHCPGCSEDHSCVELSFTNISPVAEKMILDILVKCEKSLQAVKLCTIKPPCEQHNAYSRQH